MMNLRSFPCRDTAVDLGSATVRVHVEGRGVVVREPSALARSVENGRIVAVGAAALELARKGAGVVLIRPVRDGVPAEAGETESMLRHLLRGHHRNRYLAKPRMAVAVPSGLTPVQAQAVRDAAYQAGARQLTVVPKPVAAALGADVPVHGADTAIVADIGAEVTDVGVITYGTLVGSHMVRVGGAALDRAIVSAIRREHGIVLPAVAAEAAKLAVGAAAPRGRRRNRQILVHGRDVRSGLPRSVVLSSDDVCRAIAAPVAAIVDAVRVGIGGCSPEIAGELMAAGLTLTGGTAALPGLDRLLHAETGLRTSVAANAADAAVTGAADFLRTPRERKTRSPAFQSPAFLLTDR